MSESPAKCRLCGATTRLGNGLCLSCTLREGLDRDREASRESFEAVLVEDEVRDTHWRVGNYEILEEIGRGGMGVIYRARQRHSRRIVALKRMVSYHADSHETRERFRREAEAAASLDHPNILPIYEVGHGEDGLPFFSMKYAAGGSLQKAGPTLRTQPRECVRLMAKVARAVQYAHEHGVLHRDLKPGNILLDGLGEPFVTDFGLAKWLDTNTDLTRTLTIFGTPGYIAPEQARGARAQLTPAADVYSLGAILFDLFTGRPPFLGEHALAVIQQASEKPAPKLRSIAPALDRDLETICAKCLEREPQMRYQSAGALADDLERWLRGHSITARRVLAPVRIWRWLKRNPALGSATIAALVFATAATFLFFSHKSKLPAAPSDKSIAVLPFENLSDKENLYFTQGIQDEILTKLANIADLRVTGRASVMEYQPAMTRDTRSIGRELGVAHLLTGSVQRAGNKLRVSVRLIDTRDDTQVWTKTYDRPLADVFSIETDITKTTAAQLHATVLPNEEIAIERPPTRDLTAFALYAQAKELVLKLGLTGNLRPTLEQAADLLDRAVSHDRKFLLAYCQLAFVHDLLYFFGHDHTPARLALAEAALQSALRINPNAGETHLAQARHLYYGYLKYDQARAELVLAERSLPNDPLIFQLRAFIGRRQNRWKEAEQDLKRALERDPRNFFILQQLSLLYEKDRRYPEIAAILDRALAIIPGDIDTRVDRAVVDLNWRADTQPLYATIQSVLAEKPDAAKQIADSWLLLALCERDAPAAEHALTALGQDSFAPDAILLNHNFGEGLVARMTKDEAKARAAFTRARAEQEKILQEQPDYGPSVCVLGLIDAALGRKEDALREGRRALELLPPTKDAINGGHIQFFFAITCAWVGEKDLAIEQLATLAQTAGFVTYGTLKLHPFWDPLRGDPGFERIVASLAPQRGVTGESAGLNKSIAVLPFANLSDKENIYFTQGIQDEILTDLANIADLRVISRTSVMQYQPETARDARSIGQTLGVNYVVEGSVQRAAGKVRVNAQLINARNDAHVWAHTYDGDLADVFAIQSQIAKAIANALEAKLSPREKAAIEQAPTIDLVAFDLYSHAKALNLSITYTGAHRQVLLQATDLLSQAVARDPSFFQAHCQLVDAHTELYLLGIDRSPERLALAQKELDAAFRLQPDAGEAHLSRAVYLYRVHLDYDGALRELQRARETLPNSPGVFELTGYIRRRQGYWEDSVQNLKRSLELDPRNIRTLYQIAISYYGLRRYSDAIAMNDRVLAIKPDDVQTQVSHAAIELDWKADTRPMRRVIDSIRKNNPAELPTIADTWLMAALAERNPTDAEAALVALGDGNFGTNWVELNHRFAEGLVARMTKDDARAHAAFTAARVAQEKVVKAQPDFGPAWCALGLIDAGLGNKEEALREGRHAIELLPMAKDSVNGAHMIEFFAVVAAWVGERGLACEQLEKTTRMTRGWIVTYGQLKLSPVWDPLRGDPRFEKFVASFAPKN